VPLRQPVTVAGPGKLVDPGNPYAEGSGWETSEISQLVLLRGVTLYSKGKMLLISLRRRLHRHAFAIAGLLLPPPVNEKISSQ
jgi:hypothetical protein